AAHMGALTDLMVEVVDQEVSALAARGDATVDMAIEMSAMAQRVLLETMLGQGLDRGETDRLGQELQIALAGMTVRMFLYFLPDGLPLPGEKRYRASVAAIDEAMLRLVRTRRETGSAREDLLSLL